MIKRYQWIFALVLGIALIGAPPRVGVRSSGPHLMPPHPDLVEAAKNAGKTLPTFLSVDRVSRPEGPLAPNAPNSAAPPASGTFKTLAILVQFSDNLAQADPTYFDNLLFGSGQGTMPHYYTENSYGQLTIVGVTLPSDIGWKTMPNSYAYYVNNYYGLTYPGPQNAQGLARDAILAADSLVDFTEYDNDNNGVLDTVFIIHAGPGAEYTGSTNDIWSHSWSVPCCLYVDGVRVSSYTMEPEYWLSPDPTDMTVGVYAHELGHVFGLPDLYDTDYSSNGVGRWSLMAGGSWNGTRGNSPAHFDAWSKVELGWVTPINVTDDLVGAAFPAVETSPTIYRLQSDVMDDQEYFLVENRQKTGYDAALPGDGLLIWHVDDNRSNNRQECTHGNNWECGSQHFLVALEQSNGFWQLEFDASNGNSGHPWPGSFNKREFTFLTIPSSSSYYTSDDTLVQVLNISNSGATMTADLHVNVAGQSVELEAGWNLIALSIIPEDPDPAAIFSPINGQYDGAYAYENCGETPGWRTYQPGGGGTLTALGPEQGVWLHMLEAATLAIPGTSITETLAISLCTGWNLIGYPSAEPANVSDALVSVSEEYQSIFAFDASDPLPPWKQHNDSLPPYAGALNTLSHLAGGYGYWLLMTEDAILTVEP